MGDMHFRLLSTEDEAEFQTFLGNWIKHIPVQQRFEWLYRGNPHGRALTWIAVDADSGRIVGCTSGFPRRMWAGNRVILTCIGGDGYVDPSFRRRGIALSLHELSLKDMRDRGIRFLFGFPVPANFKAFIKAGAVHPGDFRQTKLRLKVDPLVRKMRIPAQLTRAVSVIGNLLLKTYAEKKLAGKRDRRGRLVEVRSFDERFDRLGETIMPGLNICGVRDSKYLNWRYRENPTHAQKVIAYEVDGDLVGFAAVEVKEAAGILFDFFVRNEEKIAAGFLAELAEWAISSRLESLETMINSAGPYANAFHSVGFGFQGPGTGLMALVDRTDEDLPLFKDPRNWYLTFADEDLEHL